MHNTFGNIYKLTSFGASHGIAIGGVIDGVPAGVSLDLDVIQSELDRRKPGQSKLTTQRKEDDKVIFLSGIFEGKTTGAPIGFMIENTNSKSQDYEHLRNVFRPSHADYTYEKKYGIRDHRGGGRSSARTTASIVVAGAIAKQMIKGIDISAYVNAVGDLKLDKSYQDLDLENTESNAVRCPDAEMAQRFADKILKVKKQGDTIGGQVTCVIRNLPAGLGEPVFDKLQARLAYAMLNIPAVKGFEYGSGFAGSEMKGTMHNDYFEADGSTQTNFSGGIQGGISNGMHVYFTLAFKPVATLMQSQKALSKEGKIVEIAGKGRHDACVVPRAVPIVEAFAAMVILDFMLLQNAKI